MERPWVAMEPAPRDRLISEYDGDPELGELIARFVSGLAVRVGVLREANRRGDVASLSRLAHDLKGTGGAFGFNPISICAAELELAIKRGMEAAQIYARAEALAALCARAAARIPVDANSRR